MTKCEICEREFNDKQALEMHNRSKHPQKVKNKFSSKEKKKIKKYVIAVVILTVIIVLVYLKITPKEDAPVIILGSSLIEFGDVSQSQGAVSKEVMISNEGKNDLIIKGMDTSCACTSATLVYQGKESPRFSMANHGTNPTKFELVIPPGDNAQLKIYYDPNVHKTMRGSVTRSIYITSNDPRDSRKEVRIYVNQVD